MTLSVQEKFDKATKYVRGLPKDGPYQPDQDTQLKVRTHLLNNVRSLRHLASTMHTLSKVWSLEPLTLSLTESRIQEPKAT